MNILKPLSSPSSPLPLPPSLPLVYRPDDAENPCLSSTGRSKVRHSVNVLCVSKQANSAAAHLPYYSTSASGRHTLVRARSVHLSLFDSMFNDRLTKDLQMWAGINFAKVGFHCVCNASVLMCIIWSFNQAIRSVSESNSKPEKKRSTWCFEKSKARYYLSGEFRVFPNKFHSYIFSKSMKLIVKNNKRIEWTIDWIWFRVIPPRVKLNTSVLDDILSYYLYVLH